MIREKDKNVIPPNPKKQKATDQSLDEALSDLEHILESPREVIPSNIEPSPAGDQYTIPLLGDIDSTNCEPHQNEQATTPIISMELDEQVQAVIQRLTDELEIIVQSATEDALHRANKDIAKQVRKHLNIVLGEILDELVNIKSPERF